MFNRQGKPEEELFLKKPSSEPDTPTVEPLRIHKRESLASQSSGSQSGGSAAGGSGAPRAPTSSAAQNPLPYPSYPSERQPTPPQPVLPYPDDLPSGAASRAAASPPPLRPVGANGHAASPPPGTGAGAAQTAPRPWQRDEQISPTLAERRGNGPLPFPDSPDERKSGGGDDDGLFARKIHRPGGGPQDGRAAAAVRAEPPRQAQAAAPKPYVDPQKQYRPLKTAGKPSAASVPIELDAHPVRDSTASVSTTKAQRGSPPPQPQPPASLAAPKPSSVNRLNSTASTSTTRAERGSPPPPETPISPAGDIESRYAAAGIAGAATLQSLQAQNAAAALRAHPYAHSASRAMPYASPQLPPQPQPQGPPPPRPWTPTEPPGTHPYGPPTIYQGPSEVTSAPPQPMPPMQNSSVPTAAPMQAQGRTGLEDDVQRLHMSSSPPPAYSSVSHGMAAGQGYPAEKSRYGQGQGAPAAAISAPAPASVPLTSTMPPAQPQQFGMAGAFQEPHHLNPTPPPVQEAFNPAPHVVGPHVEPPMPSLAAPPPLPEGWIAHLDQNSGQYYYIHLPTQSTQWEFPRGPTPLNMTEPLSPTVSAYSHPLASPGMGGFGAKPLASPAFPSPGFPPLKPGYADSVMSVGGASAISVGTAMSGPPPSSGVDMYKVAPTNGVYFGPYLRYINMDLERGLWLGSILLVTDAAQPPSIHIHQTIDLSPNPRQLTPRPIRTHQRWVFYRYDVDLQMEDEGTAKWTYAVTSHLGCTRYEFLVAGRHETNWRFVAHSGNDFSIHVNVQERQRLGGVGFMWKDLLQKHADCGGFHAQLGVGDQIYADRLWKDIPLLKQWLAMSGKENRRNAPWTAKHEEEVTHAYFHYYTSHFDQPFLREAFAQIPHILQMDDHDIFDGFGSYPDYMQMSHMVKNIGRIGIEMFLLFQHHTNFEILRNVSGDQDIFTITGSGWHFVKYLGPAVVVVGPDCRSERNQHQVMAGPTYQGLFPKVATLPASVQHCVWMVPVPLIYPRLEAAESLANTVATGKKAVTGAYNVLGRVTSSVAGVVGAKGVVGEGFNSVKRAVGKAGLMGGVLSPFGDIDVLDELRDQWTHESKDLERTYLIRTLQGIAHQKSIRMTFISGDVNSCGAGLVHDPAHPSDHKTMYQIITSSIVNAPAPGYVIKLLHSNKPLYVPQNGQRSTHAPSDAKEDMLELFQTDVNGAPREWRRLMPRRNYVVFAAFDPDLVGGGGGGGGIIGGVGGGIGGGVGGGGGSMTPAGVPGGSFFGPGKGSLSLAVDFMVQGDGVYSGAVKYGPVVIPSLEYGR